MDYKMHPGDEVLDGLKEYVAERHWIFLEKEIYKKDWPWSSDIIFQEYRFGNVFRGLDRGTIWLKNNLIEPNRDGGKILLFNLLAYRIFNSIPTAEFVGYIQVWNRGIVEERLKTRWDSGVTVFGRAGMVAVQGNQIQRGCTVLDKFWKDLDSIWEGIPSTIKGVNKYLMQFDGMRGLKGCFNALSYEIALDLTYTPILADAPDKMEWPGRSFQIDRGFKEVFNQKYRREDQYVEMMRWLLKEINEDGKRRGYIPNLDMGDLCATLRGFYVYRQVYLGRGRPRSRYRRVNDSEGNVEESGKENRRAVGY